MNAARVRVHDDDDDDDDGCEDNSVDQPFPARCNDDDDKEEESDDENDGDEQEGVQLSNHVYSTRLLALSTDLKSHIFSYLNEADLWLLLQHGARVVLDAAIAQTLQSKTHLRLSYLLQIYPNKSGRPGFGVENTLQQQAVQRILQMILFPPPQRQGRDGDDDGHDDSHNYNLQYLECSNLRALTGRDWLQHLPSSLTSLSLEGCEVLSPGHLQLFLERSTSHRRLKHLNLTGCTHVNGITVSSIAEFCPQLESLYLGGCSKEINYEVLHPILTRLTKLKHLGLHELDHVSDMSGRFMAHLPTTLESVNIATCKQLRLAGVEALEGIRWHMNHLGRTTPDYWSDAPICRHNRMRHLVLDGVGTPRVGLCRGIIAYFAMGRQLREVHILGCEQIQDWEIEGLAVACAATLTCIQMACCRVGDKALKALAKYCQVLAEIDVSACFFVTDEGIQSLSEAQSYSTTLVEGSSDGEDGSRKRLRGSSQLKTLKAASLPGLTAAGMDAIAKMERLHVLDVENCINISPEKLMEIVLQLPYLIDVNGKDIQEPSSRQSSFSSLLREAARTSTASTAQKSRFPKGLRMVNRRYFSWDKTRNPKPSPSSTSSVTSSAGLDCCSARSTVQRLDTPFASMYHCIDCHLVPSVDRSICACCVSKCHQGHQTFLGSWARFYCDCPFGAAGNECQAMFPTTTSQQRTDIPAS